MLHSNAVAGDIHVIQQWEVADATARLALSVAATDVGKVAWQQDDNSFWVLVDDSPMTWTSIIPAAVLGETAGGTGQSSYTTGDILYSDASNSLDKLAIGTNGQVLTVTSGVPAWEDATGGGIDPATKWEEYYELVTFNAAEFSQYANGTNAAVTYAAATAGHPGVIEMVTGTTATGQAGILKTSAPQTSGLGNIVFGGGELVFEALVEIPVLWSVGVQEGFIRAGFMDEISGAPANGAHMQYQAANAEWLLFTRAGGTSTSVTGLTNVTTGWHYIKIVVNAAATQVDMYVDGVLEATSTTNIPTLGVSYGVNNQKNTGTTSYAYRCDMLKVSQTFTTPRY